VLLEVTRLELFYSNILNSEGVAWLSGGFITINPGLIIPPIVPRFRLVILILRHRDANVITVMETRLVPV